MSETEPNPDYFIASSFTAGEPYERRFGMLPTAELALEINADGTQYFINFDRLAKGLDDPGEFREFNRANNLESITHLPGSLTKSSIDSEVRSALQIASDMSDPLPGLGAIACVVHHDPTRQDGIDEIAHSLEDALRSIKGSDGRHQTTHEIRLAIENFYPNPQNIRSQIEQFNEDFEYLKRFGLPVMRVIDLNRIYPRLDGKAVEDPEDQMLRLLVETAHDEQIIVHAVDKHDMDKSMRDDDNAARVGTGKLREKYELFTEIAREKNINLVCVVDESEKKLITTPAQLEDSRNLFRK